jgi:hypothetical protein
MYLTINSSILKHIYTGITTVYYAHLENENLFPETEVKNIQILKENIAKLLDVDNLFFQQQETIFNSPFIRSYSKAGRDQLNIDFSLPGLLIIKKCLEIRLDVLVDFLENSDGNPQLSCEIEDSIHVTENVLDDLEMHMIPLYN